jgi:hypothetical protein
MAKEMNVYRFNDIPSPSLFFISFIYFHMVFNSSSIFMSISNLILLYNMDMKKHILLCLFMIFWKIIEIIIILNNSNNNDN